MAVYSGPEADYTDTVTDDGLIAGFVKIAKQQESVIERDAPGVGIMYWVGDEAPLTYRLEDGNTYTGSKRELTSQMKELLGRTDLSPVTRYELACFLGDENCASDALNAISQLLDGLVPGLANTWIRPDAELKQKDINPIFGSGESTASLPEAAEANPEALVIALRMMLMIAAARKHFRLRRSRSLSTPAGIPRTFVETRVEKRFSSLSPDELFERALCEQRNHKHHRALELFKRALGQRFGGLDRAHVQYYMAKSLAFIGQTQVAYSLIQEALSIACEHEEHEMHSRCLLDIAALHGHNGRIREALQLVRRAERYLRRCNPTSEWLGSALVLEGKLHRCSGYPGRALRVLAKAQQHFSASGDELGEADTLYELGTVAFYTSDLEMAFDRQSRALSIYRVNGSRFGEARCLMRVAQIHMRRGEVRQAQTLLAQSLDMYRTMETPHEECVVLNEIGSACIHEGRTSDALAHYEAAKRLSEELDARWIEARIHGNLAILRYDLGELDEAMELNLRALSIYRGIGDPYGKARATNNLANIHSDRGDVRLAKQMYEKALAAFRTISDLHGEAAALNNIGICCLQTERIRPRHALRCFEEARKVYIGMGDPEDLGIVLNNLGEAELCLHRSTRAAAYFEAALSQLEVAKNPLGIGHTHGNLAYARAELGDSDSAENHYLKAEFLLASRELEPSLAEARAKWGLALILLHQKDAAIGVLKSAQEIYGRRRIRTRWSREATRALDKLS
ncbi:tetratricopeptide repeat protein [Candidatus Bipolaricaulota bacterium]|nr:tetratricopeptide repeat protein [Candidatus Bipolaricaulota bacterium]